MKEEDRVLKSILKRLNFSAPSISSGKRLPASWASLGGLCIVEYVKESIRTCNLVTYVMIT